MRPNAERLKLTLFVATLAALFAALPGGTRSSAESKQHTQTPVASSTRTQTQMPAQSPTAAPSSTPAPTSTPAPRVEGCVSCHGQIEPMHATRDGRLEDGKDGQGLSCTYCHGGNPFGKTEDEAHVRPRFPSRWRRDGKPSSANPERTNTLLAEESREFVRFINPGDLRVASLTCSSSGCHAAEVEATMSSMMRHGAMLWGAALYNNSGYPLKDARFGESYSEATGAPERLIQIPEPTESLRRLRGVLSFLDPLPRWEVSQPGNVLRVFERGGRRRLEVGLPDKEEEPGKPDKGLSARGFGTANRTDPVYLGIQKTRLLDPTLNFLGTNDHPGDYRSSGCTACHVVYANDTSVVHSSPVYAGYGNTGTTATEDKSFATRRGESGHPVRHQLTLQIPTSQCMVCHMHPGTNMVASFLGFTWWDNETEGDKMYPARQRNPSQEDEQRVLDRNPEAASLRGLWSGRDFLLKTGTPEFNRNLTRTQFAAFNGHGWVYRAVFKKNRRGYLLDSEGEVVRDVTADKLRRAVEYRDTDGDSTTEPPAGQPVHLKDIHLERGMHCIDCHFRQDSHGNGILYNEPRAAVEIGCVDCHGTISKAATLVTSGPAAGQSVVEKDGKLTLEKGAGRRLAAPRSGPRLLARNLYTKNSEGARVPVFERVTEDGTRKLAGRDVTLRRGDVIQNSLVEPGLWWRVPQTLDTVTPGRPDYNWRSHYAKTVRLNDDGMETWGEPVPEEKDEAKLAHPDSKMTCFACHSSWMTSCFGCHLSMTANRKMPNRHNEGDESRNFTSYNYQVLRDDVFMLGRDGTVTGNRVAPVRSSSAVLVSSQNQNREWIYSQQQTVSAEGFNGQAFNTHVPHTVRSRETKGCADCHVSEAGDNNAWMAQLLLQGTNFVNFMGRYVYVAAEHSLEVVPVTERAEPQAVYGSTLHKVAFPDNFARFVASGRQLKTFYEHKGNPEVLQVQLRGEYAYVAAGRGGLRVYDVAQIDHKGFSERIVTAPVSPLGQKFYVDTKYATAVAAPTTLAVDPARWRLASDGTFISPEEARRRLEEWQKLSPEERAARPHPLPNEEQPIHPLYGYIYVADREEGLILVGAATLLDGVPTNNFLKRELTFNPGGALDGANNIQIAGTHAYVTTDSALVIINLDDPLRPRVVARFDAPAVKHPKAVAIQFRYAFVVDEEGLKVFDVTDPARARRVEGA
ncbi:MAG TPA: multiheme c-type cytochrome, partial [Pyrinomonadaceae bacterium]|nr:multiheme c-type cytochrome [Pyrinomonadaceae bacterium]